MDPFCYLCFVFVYHTVLSVPCSTDVTYWERADLLALLCVMFSCVFDTFPYDVSGQVWYLIALIPDNCLLLYFVRCKKKQVFSCRGPITFYESCFHVVLSKNILGHDVFIYCLLICVGIIPNPLIQS